MGQSPGLRGISKGMGKGMRSERERIGGQGTGGGGGQELSLQLVLMLCCVNWRLLMVTVMGRVWKRGCIMSH